MRSGEMHSTAHNGVDAGHESSLQVRPWVLMETAVPSGSEIPIHEALFSIGNGFIGFRGYHERMDLECVATPRGGCGGSALLNSSGLANARSSVFETTITQNPVAGPVRSQRGCYINGVYDESLVEHVGSAFTSGTCKRECAIVPVPDLLSVEVSINDERVAPSVNPEQVNHYRRALNLKTGELTRRFTWTTSSGVVVKVLERRLVCAARKNIVAAQYTYTVVPSSRNPSSVDAQVVSETVLPDGPASSNWEVESVTKTERVEDVVSVLSARTRRSRKHVTIVTNERCAVGQMSSNTPDWTPMATSLPCASGTTHMGGNASFAFAKTESGSAAQPAPGGTEVSSPLAPMMTSPHTGSTNAVPLQTVPQLMPFTTSSSNYFTEPTAAVDRRTGPIFGASLGIPPPLTAADCSPMVHLRPSSPVLGTPFATANHHDTSAAASEPSAEDPPGREPTESLLTVFRGLLHCSDPSATTTLVFTKIASCFTDVDCDVEDMEAKASEQLEAALDLKYDGLLQEQQECMAKFWAASDVAITANDDTQGTLRFNILQLFMSAGRWKWTAVGPRGLTGEVFNGLQSVDAELFVVPFFVHSNPPTAKSILQFRVDTLPEAQRRALEFELKRGAIYPPRTINGGDNAPSLSCALHLHVNADIVYAIKQYYEATLDVDFMLRGGIEVVWQTALVWLEWGAWEKGVFHLRNVTGPDEYNVLVDDNYYTNLMAQHHMRFAVEILDRLQAQFPQELERLMSAQSCTSSCSCAMQPCDFIAMRDAADKMSLPYDPHHRIHLQDASFLQKRSWDKVLKKESASGVTSSPHVRGGKTTSSMPPSSQTSSGAHLSDFVPANHKRVGDWAANRGTGAATPGEVKTYANAATVTPPPYMSGTVGTPAVMIQEYHPVVVFRHRICKTADVVFASILLRDRFTRDEKEANFKFYETLTAHDSSLSAPTFCIAASDVQLRDTAMRYFLLSLNIDVHNILKNTSGGLHMSCLGGSWLCIVSGFGGFHVLNGVAHFHPWMPEGWDEYRFSVRHQAAVIQVHVTRRQVTYALLEGSKLLVIHAQASRVHLAKGRPVTIKLLRDVRSFDFDAVVFDLDSIVDNVEEDHFESWRRTLDPLFQQLEGPQYKPFNHEMYLAYLKHHPISLARRHQGLQKLLAKRGLDVPVGDPTDDTPSAHTMYGLIARKLQHFRSVVKERGVKVREGALALLSDLRENGVAIGVVSASKNGHWILQQSPRVRHAVDCFIDATVGEEHHLRWRPELDYFDWCTRRLDTTTSRTIVIIDGIDGFSKKSLQHYWMVVNTSVDDAFPEASMGTAVGEDGAVSSAMPEDIQPLNVADFSGLTTDVLHERGSFLSPVHRQQGTPPFKVGHAPDRNASFTSLAT